MKQLVKLRITFRRQADATEFARRIHTSTWKSSCLRSGKTVYILVPKTRLKRLTEVVQILGGEAKPFERTRRVSLAAFRPDKAKDGS